VPTLKFLIDKKIDKLIIMLVLGVLTLIFTYFICNRELNGDWKYDKFK